MLERPGDTRRNPLLRWWGQAHRFRFELTREWAARQCVGGGAACPPRVFVRQDRPATGEMSGTSEILGSLAVGIKADCGRVVGHLAFHMPLVSPKPVIELATAVSRSLVNLRDGRLDTRAIKEALREAEVIYHALRAERSERRRPPGSNGWTRRPTGPSLLDLWYRAACVYIDDLEGRAFPVDPLETDLGYTPLALIPAAKPFEFFPVEFDTFRWYSGRLAGFIMSRLSQLNPEPVVSLASVLDDAFALLANGEPVAMAGVWQAFKKAEMLYLAMEEADIRPPLGIDDRPKHPLSGRVWLDRGIYNFLIDVCRPKPLKEDNGPSRPAAKSLKEDPDFDSPALDSPATDVTPLLQESYARDGKTTDPIESTLLLVAGSRESSRLIRFLASRDNRRAHLDEIAAELDHTPRVSVMRRRGTIRQRFNRTRDQLEKLDARARLAIEKGVVSLVVVDEETDLLQGRSTECRSTCSSV